MPEGEVLWGSNTLVLEPLLRVKTLLFERRAVELPRGGRRLGRQF